MGRVVPIGRDRPGLLGAPFGAGSAFAHVNSAHAINLKDFIFEGRVYLKDCGGAQAGLYKSVNGSNDIRIVWSDSNGWRLTCGANYYVPGDSPYGRIVHVMYFADRDGYLYVFVDGQYVGSVDISAGSTWDYDGTDAIWGGRTDATYNPAEIYQLCRLFVLTDDLPVLDDCKVIAAQRYENPEVEAPILAARADYNVARRFDVDFMDVDQDGTTAPNKGTSGDMTFGGSFEWRDVRTVAQAAAVVKPGEDWFSFDGSHQATVSGEDLGCVQGSYVMEIVYRDGALITTASQEIPARVMNNGNTEALLLSRSTSGALKLTHRSNSVDTDILYFDPATYAEYGRKGLVVLHLIADAVADTFAAYLNGQLLCDPISVATDLNLSGNCDVELDDSGAAHNILAMRLWNAALVSSDLEEEIYRRVDHPWSSALAFPGMSMKGNWEMRAGAQKAASQDILNLAQSGVADLPISGGGTFGGSRVIALKGAA